MREKFEASDDDQLIGLEIFASQKKIDEFSDLYNKLLAEAPATPTPATAAPAKEGEVAAPVKQKLTQEICEQIAKNLMFFDSDKEKQRRLEMAERLFRRVIDANISFSGKLFDSLVFVFTESQQWRQLIETLNSVSPRNCTPDVKTLNYLKKNLLYCFEPQVRSQLKEQIENLEDTFFTAQVAAQSLAAQVGSANQQEGGSDKKRDDGAAAQRKQRGIIRRERRGDSDTQEGDVTIEKS